MKKMLFVMIAFTTVIAANARQKQSWPANDLEVCTSKLLTGKLPVSSWPFF